jgi:hypothetical protein
MFVRSVPWKHGHSPAFWDASFENGIIINRTVMNHE